MSYDSRLYIVEEASFKIPCDNGKRYAHIVGMIELCSCPNMLDVFTKDSNGYIYSDDGNTKIETDCHGNPLMVADIDDVINAATAHGYGVVKRMENKGWACITFKKQA